MKFNNLDIFQSIKLRIYTDIILPISLKLNFTLNTLGCYGLKAVQNCAPQTDLNNKFLNEPLLPQVVKDSVGLLSSCIDAFL